jgi:hypothetical protein
MSLQHMRVQNRERAQVICHRQKKRLPLERPWRAKQGRFCDRARAGNPGRTDIEEGSSDQARVCKARPPVKPRALQCERPGLPKTHASDINKNANNKQMKQEIREPSKICKFSTSIKKKRKKGDTGRTAWEEIATNEKKDLFRQFASKTRGS